MEAVQQGDRGGTVGAAGGAAMKDDDLDRELQVHLEIEGEEQRERGLSPEEATCAARRTLGRSAPIKEDVRELSPWTPLETVGRDVGYSIRMLRKHPTFMFAVAVTLALGIGASTALFTLV